MNIMKSASSRFPPLFNYEHAEIAKAGGGSSSIGYRQLRLESMGGCDSRVHVMVVFNLSISAAG